MFRIGLWRRYANRPRGIRRRAERACADPAVPIVTAPRLAPTEATRRWAALLRQRVEVDPLVCPRCAELAAVRMSFVERDLRVSGDPSIYYLTPHYVGHPVVLVADSVST